MLIQFLIKVLPIPVPERYSNSESHDSIYFCFPAFLQQLHHIFFGIIDKRKNRCHPYDCRNPFFFHNIQHFNPALRRTDLRLQYPAQIFLVSRQCHLNNTLCLSIDPFQKIQIPQDHIRFCLNRKPIPILIDQFQTTPCQPKIFFQMQIRIAHSPGADHTFFPFPAKCLLQKPGCIDLHLNILKIMAHLVAGASGITVYTAMCTSSVYIHSVLCRKNSFYIYFMHVLISCISHTR